MSLSAYFGSLSVANLLSSMPAAAAQGMIWGLMALGVFITFRVLDIADLLSLIHISSSSASSSTRPSSAYSATSAARS